MATKTISLAEDAYARLKAMKREGESFSDVVRRLTAGVALEDFHGALSEETADELAAVITELRERRSARRRARRDRLDEALDDP